LYTGPERPDVDGTRLPLIQWSMLRMGSLRSVMCTAVVR
jgi:hypothetical protein